MHNSALAKSIFCSDEGKKVIKAASPAICEYEISRKKIAEIKTMCTRVIVSSLGAEALAEAAGALLRPVNKYERVEIEALFYYTIKKTGVALEALHHDIRSCLAISLHDAATVMDYRRIRNYLWCRAAT